MGYKPSVNLDEMKSIIIRNILLNLNHDIPYTPINIEGPPGIGKTELVFQCRNELAEITGNTWGIYDFRAGQKTAQDLYGVPMSGKTTFGDVYLEFVKDKALPGVLSDVTPEYGIFFIDELTTTTDEPLRAGLLQLMTDREIAGYRVPDKWYIVGAGNRRQDGNIYVPLSFPLLNRMQTYDMRFVKEVWVEYMQKRQVHQSIINYINNQVHDADFLTYKPDEDIGEELAESNYVCATPRSWFVVNNKLKSAELMPDISRKQLEKEIQAVIGDDLGKKFFRYYDKFQGEELGFDLILQKAYLDEAVPPTPKITSSLIEHLTKLSSKANIDPANLSQMDIDNLNSIIEYLGEEYIPQSVLLPTRAIISEPLLKLIRDQATSTNNKKLIKFMTRINDEQSSSLSNVDMSWK